MASLVDCELFMQVLQLSLRRDLGALILIAQKAIVVDTLRVLLIEPTSSCAMALRDRETVVYLLLLLV